MTILDEELFFESCNDSDIETILQAVRDACSGRLTHIKERYTGLASGRLVEVTVHDTQHTIRIRCASANIITHLAHALEGFAEQTDAPLLTTSETDEHIDVYFLQWQAMYSYFGLPLENATLPFEDRRGFAWKIVGNELIYGFKDDVTEMNGSFLKERLHHDDAFGQTLHAGPYHTVVSVVSQKSNYPALALFSNDDEIKTPPINNQKMAFRIVNEENIDDWIEKWHTSETGMSLPNYLGLTIDEYARFVENGKLDN